MNFIGHPRDRMTAAFLFFVAMAYRWPCPRGFLLLGLALGFMFVFTQWLRGAHFPSHDLWTASGCWALSWLLFRYGFQQRLAASPGMSARDEPWLTQCGLLDQQGDPRISDAPSRRSGRSAPRTRYSSGNPISQARDASGNGC